MAQFFAYTKIGKPMGEVFRNILLLGLYGYDTLSEIGVKRRDFRTRECIHSDSAQFPRISNTADRRLNIMKAQL